MTRLTGAHVVITGGSEGIGLETARQLLARGARVSLVSRSRDKLRAAQESLGAAVAVEAADVTDEPGLRAALERLAPCDVLVAAAGGAEPGYLREADSAALRRQMDLNHFGAVFAVRAVLPGMLARGGGHVVLVSSTAGLCGVFGYAGYSPAKAALRAFADVLEAEHGDDGVRVSVAYPPDTLTPGFARENVTKPAETAAVSAMVEPVPPERVARALVDGIARDRRTITADRTTALLAGGNLVLPAARVAMRRAVRRAQTTLGTA